MCVRGPHALTPTDGPHVPPGLAIAHMGHGMQLAFTDPGGAVSQYLYGLPLGTPVAFRHTAANLKVQYPFEGKKTITMLCAGTGITPIYQALWRVLFTPGDERKVVLLYGARTEGDILLKDQLDEWAAALPHRLTLVYVVGNAPDDPPPAGWKSRDTYVAEAGWIDRRKIEKYAFPPARDTLCFVCGLPSMYATLCGPREEKAVREGSVLAELGYTTPMVAKL